VTVTFAVLADYANVTRDGKLNVMGIFDRVFARQLPSRFPPMKLVVRLETQPTELNTEHGIRVQLAGPDGDPLFDINGTFTPRGAAAGRPITVNHVIGLADLPLRRTGDHAVLIWVDGELQREVPLRVDEPPRQPIAEGASEPTFH
jgi:hypothetical protein